MLESELRLEAVDVGINPNVKPSAYCFQQSANFCKQIYALSV